MTRRDSRTQRNICVLTETVRDWVKGGQAKREIQDKLHVDAKEYFKIVIEEEQKRQEDTE